MFVICIYDSIKYNAGISNIVYIGYIKNTLYSWLYANKE